MADIDSVIKLLVDVSQRASKNISDLSAKVETLTKIMEKQRADIDILNSMLGPGSGPAGSSTVPAGNQEEADDKEYIDLLDKMNERRAALKAAAPGEK